MKPFNGRQTTQRQLAFEADESQIWDTLDKSQQDQVTDCLARLWVEHVTQRQAISASSDKQE